MHLKLPSTKQRNRGYRNRFLIHAVSYRIPFSVTKIVKYPTTGECYPICPRCRNSIEREYMRFCDRCGQKLSWYKIDNAKILTAPIRE